MPGWIAAGPDGVATHRSPVELPGGAYLALLQRSNADNPLGSSDLPEILPDVSLGDYRSAMQALNASAQSGCQRDRGGRFSIRSPAAQAMRRSSSARLTSLSGQRM